MLSYLTPTPCEIPIVKCARGSRSEFIQIASFLCDPSDYEILSHHRWFLSRSRDQKPYPAYRKFVNGKQLVFLAHRLVMGLPPRGSRKRVKQEVDHKDGNPFDCRKTNLRITSYPWQQRANSGRRHNSTATYPGVFPKRYPCGFLWTAMVASKPHIYLGLWPTEVQGGLAKNIAMKLLFGEYAKVFPIPDGAVPPELHNEIIRKVKQYVKRALSKGKERWQKKYGAKWWDSLSEKLAIEKES